MIKKRRVERGGVWLRAGALALVCVALYANSLHGPLIVDDHATIEDNLQIRHLWSTDVLFPARELPVAGRPVVNVTFALNYAWGGFDVTSYHVVNIALHLLCALVLFGLVRRTLNLPSLRDQFSDQSLNLAFAVALLWMVHPLQTEVVDYLTERTESVMALWFLLTVYASVRGLGSAAWQAAAVAACALGMASKESMVTAPVIVVLYDWAFCFDSIRAACRARWTLYAGLALTWAMLAALIWSGPRSSSAGFSAGVSAWTYLLNQTVMITRYLRLTVWPSPLVVDYGLPRALTLGDVVPYAALVVALLALTIAALVRRPKAGFLGAWFFITLAPASSIVPVATWVGAERRMYLPLAALMAIGVLAAARVRAPARLRIAMLAVVALVFATLTFLRTEEYRSPLVLAKTVLDRYPHARAHHWYGSLLVDAGQHDEGIRHLRLAVGGDPRAHYSLGVALIRDGALDEGVSELQAFVRDQPMLYEVISAREEMGRAYVRQGKLAEAEAEFRELVRMTPRYPDAHGLLAEVLLKEGRPLEAIDHYAILLQARPAFVDGLTNMAISLASLDRLDEAIVFFRRAAAAAPQNADVQRNLATALGDLRARDGIVR